MGKVRGENRYFQFCPKSYQPVTSQLTNVYLIHCFFILQTKTFKPFVKNGLSKSVTSSQTMTGKEISKKRKEKANKVLLRMSLQINQNKWRICLESILIISSKMDEFNSVMLLFTENLLNSQLIQIPKYYYINLLTQAFQKSKKPKIRKN